jgi:hypothetical protein
VRERKRSRMKRNREKRGREITIEWRSIEQMPPLLSPPSPAPLIHLLSSLLTPPSPLTPRLSSVYLLLCLLLLIHNDTTTYRSDVPRKYNKHNREAIHPDLWVHQHIKSHRETQYNDNYRKRRV